MQHARTQALFHACTQVGGFEAYLLADEEKEGAAAAEVYRQVGVILVDVCVCVCVCVYLLGIGHVDSWGFLGGEIGIARFPAGRVRTLVDERKIHARSWTYFAVDATTD